MLNIILEREGTLEDERTPVFLYIDECHNFITSSVNDILQEARKYKMAISLAQQVFAGGNLDLNLKDNILTNTRIKASGLNEKRIYKRIERETGVDVEELDNLRQAMFHIKVSTNFSLPVRIRSDLLNPEKYLNSEEWEHVKVDQLKKFYRPPKDSMKEAKKVKQSTINQKIVPEGEIEDL